MKFIFFLVIVLVSTKNFCQTLPFNDDEFDDNDTFDDNAINKLDNSAEEDDQFYDDGSDEGENIVGGQLIIIQKAPYQVQILNATGYTVCGGSIIDKQWVLTAAHCLYGRRRLSEYTIQTGSAFRHLGTPKKIKRTILHEDYDNMEMSNDIALIELEEPLTFSGQQNRTQILDRPINKKDEIYITGYGRTQKDGPASLHLLAAMTPVVDLENCQKAYKYTAPVEGGKQFCAGNGKTDTCQGDSGGPATIDGKLAGITSFGINCADKHPGVYTLVPAYKPWIEKETGLKL